MPWVECIFFFHPFWATRHRPCRIVATTPASWTPLLPVCRENGSGYMHHGLDSNFDMSHQKVFFQKVIYKNIWDRSKCFWEGDYLGYQKPCWDEFLMISLVPHLLLWRLITSLAFAPNTFQSWSATSYPPGRHLLVTTEERLCVDPTCGVVVYVISFWIFEVQDFQKITTIRVQDYKWKVAHTDVIWR